MLVAELNSMLVVAGLVVAELAALLEWKCTWKEEQKETIDPF
jgi:hypothetical protein